MNYKIKVKPSLPSVIINACDTKVGDIMKVTYEPGKLKHHYVGCILLHTFRGFVSLNNPTWTWSDHRCDLKVMLLPPKTKIILKTK